MLFKIEVSLSEFEVDKISVLVVSDDFYKSLIENFKDVNNKEPFLCINTEEGRIKILFAMKGVKIIAKKKNDERWMETIKSSEMGKVSESRREQGVFFTFI